MIPEKTLLPDVENSISKFVLKILKKIMLNALLLNLILLFLIEKPLLKNLTKSVWLNPQTNITEFMLKLKPFKKISLKPLNPTKLDPRMILKKDPRNLLKNSVGTENMEVPNFGLSDPKTLEPTF
jgi:hypothetical protein